MVDGIRRCTVNDDDCVPGRLRRGMCERHYRRLLRTGHTSATVTPTFERFELGPGGCWTWMGGRFPNSYGQLGSRIHGTLLAHRAFYIEFAGPVDDGLDLDHLCRVRLCVNPKHLEPVTRSINLLRGYEARMAGQCRRGHRLLGPDDWHVEASGVRTCKECWRIRYRKAGDRYRTKKRKEVMPNDHHQPLRAPAQELLGSRQGRRQDQVGFIR